MVNANKTGSHRVSALLRFGFVAWFLCYVDISHAQQAEQLDKVKAAYIYNFTKFIDFPEGRFEDDASDFNLCIKNAPELVGLFESVEGTKIKERNFRVSVVNNSSDLDACHFLYMKSSATNSMGNIVKKSLKGQFVTISSKPEFVHNGGMIGFVLVDDRVKVEINLESTRQAGFTISARLLEVSRVIDQKSGQ